MNMSKPNKEDISGEDAKANPDQWNDSDTNYDDLSAEELKAKVIELENEYKEYRSNSEKGVQKVIGKKKELEKAQANLKEVDINELVQQEVSKKMQQVAINSTLESVKAQLPESIKEDFDDEFQEITEGKDITEDNIKRYVSKALKLVDAGKGSVTALWGVTDTKSSPKTSEKERKKTAKSFVDEFWLN